MIGIVYLIATNEIIQRIEDVQSITEMDIIGLDSSVKGIDLGLASFCIVESSDHQIGDTLESFTDVRDLLPKSPDQIRIAELEAQIAEMNLSQIEFMTTILQTLGVE